MALALMLLVGSALLIRTSVALGHVDPGYDVNNVLTMRMSLSGSRFLTSAGVERMMRDGRERLQALPASSWPRPPAVFRWKGATGFRSTSSGGRQGKEPFHGGGGWATVSPGYFEVFKIPVRRGRTFTERDDAGMPPVVIINEAMANQLWKDANPLNDRLVIGRGIMREFADEPERQIVGVVADSRDGGLNNDPGPKMFIPQAQVPDAVNALNVRITPMAWVVRTRVTPMSLSAPIQEQLRQASGLPVSDVRAMSEVVSRSTSRQRFNMMLMTVFGSRRCSWPRSASTASWRTRSSSARRRSVSAWRWARWPATSETWSCVQGMRLAIVGVVIGVAVALAMARVIAGFLFGVQARDPGVFVGIPVLLSLVALVAVWLPARRASQVAPVIALRTE